MALILLLLFFAAYLIIRKILRKKNIFTKNHTNTDNDVIKKNCDSPIYKANNINPNKYQETTTSTLSTLDICINYLKSITSKILYLFMVPLRLKILDRTVGIIIASVKIITLSIYLVIKSIFNIIYKILRLIWIGVICPIGRLLDKTTKKIESSLDGVAILIEKKVRKM